MKKYWKGIGIGVAVAGLLFYPAMKLVQYIAAKRAKPEDDSNNAEDHHEIKKFAPAYRGKHKPHHRQANGNIGPETGEA